MSEKNSSTHDDIRRSIAALNSRLDMLTRQLQAQARPPERSPEPEVQVEPPQDPAPAPPGVFNFKSRSIPLGIRIRHALEDRFLDTIGLARITGESVDAVSRELAKLQRTEHVANLGSEDFPSWFWRPPKDLTHQELIHVIVRLISHQPLPTSVIVRAVGAPPDRVNNALLDIRRAHDVWDVSPGGKSKCYYMLPDHAKSTRLPTRHESRLIAKGVLPKRPTGTIAGADQAQDEAPSGAVPPPRGGKRS